MSGRGKNTTTRRLPKTKSSQIRFQPLLFCASFHPEPKGNQKRKKR